jgi:hypothetical protein
MLTQSTLVIPSKPFADRAYEILSVVERVSFWALYFTVGYIGYYVGMHTVIELFQALFLTV